MVVSQHNNDDGYEGNNPSQRQPVQKRGQLHDKSSPEPVAEKRRLIDRPLLPKRLPHDLRLHLLVRNCTISGGVRSPQCAGFAPVFRLTERNVRASGTITAAINPSATNTSI